jgi:hypothetical protein
MLSKPPGTGSPVGKKTITCYNIFGVKPEVTTCEKEAIP